MRCFIAIDIPESIRGAIRDLIGHLKPLGSNVRWARPEGLHITLKFLGEVPVSRIEAVQQALYTIPRPSPFPISIRGAGYFPYERSPRVIWLGIEAGPALKALAGAVEDAMAEIGFEKETRAYSPHLTLGRVPGGGAMGSVREALRRESLEFGSFTAGEFFLYESKPSPSGSVYSRVERVEFSGPSQ